MKLLINHYIEAKESIERFGFAFEGYDRTGLLIFRDKIGNAVFLNREDMVITLYSHVAGTEVEELTVAPQPYDALYWPMPTADTAVRLARAFGTTERFWLGLQADYDLEQAQLKLGRRLDRIPRVAA